MTMIPYNNLSGYLYKKYGSRVFKICIDGGFSCPNRDGAVGYGGCVFCGERGAGEHLCRIGIAEQVARYFARPRKADKFIAYFQNFTNTYAPVDVLRARYDAALTDDRIVALAVGTRPDCVTPAVADLLAEYAAAREVWVELGLHTSSDATAARINRGYASEKFTEAVRLLNARGIGVVAHIIVGLPGETERELAETVEFLNRHRLFGIKVHCLYVMEGTALAAAYRRGEYVPQTLRQYAASAAFVLAHIPPEVVVHKLTGDSPKDLLVAPDWNVRKDDILAAIREVMAAHGWRQGSLYR